MINKETVSQLDSIVRHLKTTDSFQWFSQYFIEKRQHEIEELLITSGSITQEELIKANARLELYEELINFDITIERELKFN
tara:strand:+ start:330 stop:572 length:243 start_codon:yes stop_codon:yes gene_type:complete